MRAFLGLLALTLAVLLAGGRALFVRRPSVPVWVTAFVTTVIVRLTTAFLLVLGLGLIVQFQSKDVGLPLSATDTELIGGMLIVLTAVLAVFSRLLWWGWESPRFAERKRSIGQGREAIDNASEPAQPTPAPKAASATGLEAPDSERIALLSHGNRT